MNIWAKMIMALQGGVNEVGEAFVDGQALRILDQEVREAAEELKESKDALAEIIARQKLAQKNCQSFSNKIKENESYALKALEKSDESLALEVASKIADLEIQKLQEEEIAKVYEDNANNLRIAIKKIESNLKRIKQQIDTVKATESVQRAQLAVAQRHNGSSSKLRTAMDSLERIKEKQALKSAEMDAAKELAEENSEERLQEKLKEAGIIPQGETANDILERLKKNN